MTIPLAAKVNALTQHTGQSEQLYRPNNAYSDTLLCKLATISAIDLVKLVMELRHRTIAECRTNAKQDERTVVDYPILSRVRFLVLKLATRGEPISSHPGLSSRSFFNSFAPVLVLIVISCVTP